MQVSFPFLGNYPFILRVWNVFPPEGIPGTEHNRYAGIQVKVEFHHHRCFFNDSHFVATPVPDKGKGVEYIINPGCVLAFPMHSKDDYAVITGAKSLLGHSIDDWENLEFQISVGAKALCFPSPEDLPDPETEKAVFLQEGKNCLLGKSDEKKVCVGGTWTFNPAKYPEWRLEIAKFGPDPVDEDVTVGPVTPWTPIK